MTSIPTQPDPTAEPAGRASVTKLHQWLTEIHRWCIIEYMTQRAQFISEDRKTMVRGFWQHRGGCLWLGEITVAHLGKVMHFSSVTPTTTDGLAGYTTPEYLAQHAGRFR